MQEWQKMQVQKDENITGRQQNNAQRVQEIRIEGNFVNELDENDEEFEQIIIEDHQLNNEE